MKFLLKAVETILHSVERLLLTVEAVADNDPHGRIESSKELDDVLFFTLEGESVDEHVVHV
jgi:hypothetical protein